MSGYNNRLREALKKEHQRVFDYEYSDMKNEYRLDIDCPICGSVAKKLLFKKDMFSYQQCGQCDMIYLSPRLNDKANADFYNSEYNSIYNEEKFDVVDYSEKNLDNSRDRDNLDLILSYKPMKGRLLEIGIGKGYFLKGALDAGFDIYGVELNSRNCEITRQVVGGGTYVLK